MVRTLTVLSVCSLLLVAPDRASACSCVEPRLVRRVVPNDGAADFPVDGTLRVFLGGFPVGVRPTLAAEYRLRDAAGSLLPLDATVVGTRLDLRPHARLSPSTTYTLEQIFAFDAAGTRLTDLERMGSHGALRGIWYPVATFRTSAGVATPRAIAPTITAARLHFAHGGGDCGPATAAQADVRLPPRMLATDIVELRVRSHGTVVSDAAEGLTSLYVGDMLCDPDPVTLPAGASLEIQAVMLDAAGTELGASAWTRAHGHGRRPTSVGRIGLLGAGTWPSVTIVAAPSTAAPRGPASCQHGLELVSRHDVVSDGAPWTYGDRTTLSTDGAARWLAYSGGEGAAMRLFTVAGDGVASSVSTTVSGTPSATLATSSGPLVSWSTYTQDAHSEGHLARLDAHGAPSWSVALPGGDGSDHRLARGDGRVFVAWARREPDYTERLAYAIFDESTGAAIASLAPTTYGLDSNSEGPATAFVDGRFLIVWGTGSGFRGGPLASLVVQDSTASAPVDLSAIDSYAPPDLAGAGTQAGLVTATHDGRVLLAVLDHDGRLASGPFEISTGVGGRDNRLPRVAWNGQAFAVAWETYPTPGVYVAIVDGTGAVSAALRVDASEPYAGSIGIAPTASGWLAGYTTDRAHGRIAELRCRASAALGPPQSIGAVP